jgi:hypothetical protein
MSVCAAIDSAHGSATVMRPVSLEPAGPEDVRRQKNFPEKWPVAELPKKKVIPLMIFYGKFFLYINIFLPFNWLLVFLWTSIH